MTPSYQAGAGSVQLHALFHAVGLGYLRDVSSQLQYCDHECYVRHSNRRRYARGPQQSNVSVAR